MRACSHSIRPLAAALVLIFINAAPQHAQAADAEAGQTVFRQQCAICHSVKPDQNKIGPSLFGAVGRKTGSVPGYAYSVANKNSNITWTPEVLDKYLELAERRHSGNQDAIRRSQGRDQACQPDRLPRNPEITGRPGSIGPRRPESSSIRRFPSRRQVIGGALALTALPMPFVRAQAAPPIRIGFPIPLTGPYEEEALDMLRGGHVAVTMFNEQGGLAGRMAELVTRDDELNPAKATEVTRELLSSAHVDFVTGGLSASVQLAINAVTKQARVVFNSISQSDEIVAAPHASPYTFHEALTPHMTTQIVGRYVFANFPKRIAFLVADYAFGHEMVAGFEAAGKAAGVEIVAALRHPLGTNDFRPYLEQFLAVKPNVVILCNFGLDQSNAVQQAEWLGLKNSMKLVTPVLDFTQRLSAGPDAYQGVLGGTSYYWRLEDSIPSARRFNTLFRTMHDGRVPSDYGALGFAGVMTVLTAAKQAGSVASDKLVAAMRGMKYDLYKGPEYYRGCDHQAVQSALIVESLYTTRVNDMDVLRIVHVEPPDEAVLQTCAAEGHA